MLPQDGQLAVPTKADHAIVDFVKHVEAQPAVRLGDWAVVEGSA